MVLVVGSVDGWPLRGALAVSGARRVGEVGDAGEADSSGAGGHFERAELILHRTAR